jgi:protein-disulfide isomerase
MNLKRTATLAILAAMASASAANVDVVEGNPAASVKVTIFTDLQCDYCQTLRAMLDEKLLPKYGSQVAFVHRDLPLGRHNWAHTAAMVTRWIYEQNPRLAIIFQRELLDEQQHITAASLKSWVTEFAARNKLSDQGITAAMTDPRLSAIVDGDVQIATTRGITKVPTVVVGNKTFSETIVYDDVARAIDQALPH